MYKKASTETLAPAHLLCPLCFFHSFPSPFPTRTRRLAAGRHTPPSPEAAPSRSKGTTSSASSPSTSTPKESSRGARERRRRPRLLPLRPSNRRAIAAVSVHLRPCRAHARVEGAGELGLPVGPKNLKRKRERKIGIPRGGETSPIPAAAAMGEGEATRQKRKKNSKPLAADPFLQTPAQSPAPGTPILEEAAAMRKRKMRKEQKAAPPLTQNPTLEEEEEEEAVLATKKKKKHKERKSSPSPSTAAAAETPISEQEAKVSKKRERSKDQEQTQSQGRKALRASKPLPAAPFLEAPARSPAPGTAMLEEAAMKMCKEHKMAVAQDTTTLEEQREDGMSAKMKNKKKESKHMEHTLSSPCTSVAAETPIWEQEAKVTKKLKHGKDQEQSCYTPLPLDPGQTQAQGTKNPHASKGIPAAPSPAPETTMLEELAVTAVMMKRKNCKEKKVAARSLAQNTALEEPREDVMLTKMKDSEHMEAEKQKKRKQQKPSDKSPLPPDRGQTHRVRSQGGKAPPEQEQEAEARKGSSIDKKNGTRPCVRVLSKRELIKEGSKKPRALPEGFVPYSDFVSSCTEQNPDQSSPYSAFFDQFRYNPVRKDRKPPLPRTPDRLARLPSRGHSSFQSSQLTMNETSGAFKSNTSVASKTKQQDSGSSSQEKLIVEVEENLRKKMREKKQSGSSLPDPCKSCCIQLQGTKAPPDQDQKADAPEVDNIKRSNGKKARVRGPSKRKLFKEMSMEQMLPVPTCTRLSMLPPRGYPSIGLPELSANGTSKACKASRSVAHKSKKKDSGSGSASSSQEKLNAEVKKKPEKKMTIKKQREPPPLLTRAEKWSDKYRRVPLDQLVPPPRSPHHLLQENYASDPWKVIVICMLLNLTQGKQVKKIVEGFFECYPDPHAAINADPEKMEAYLTYLGLQRIKTIRIQTFSKQYVENDWTYITELCGVGKYAADAYAIFCAGRATEVVPKDHKLVDYWNYVCSELPMVQGSQSVQEAGVNDQELL